MILNSFNIVTIGLERRQDRRQRCEEIFAREGIEGVEFVGTQQRGNSRMGYMQDFLAMLHKKRGKPLMFFEDDFELTEDWRTVFESAYRRLPTGWDMLYLGCNLTRRPSVESGNLYRVWGAWLMHTVLLSAEMIEYILARYDPKKWRIIDDWFRLQARKRKFFMTMPQVSYQRVDFSDMEQRVVDYQKVAFNNKFYKKAYEDYRSRTRLSAEAQRRS